MRISISFFFVVFFVLFFVLTTCEPPASKPLVFPNWPPKSSQTNKVFSKSQNSHSKAKRTLVVQIRSDKHVPFVLKRSPHHQTAMASHNQARPMRPVKLAISPQLILKGNPLITKHNVRKPVNILKIKLASSSKPHAYSEKPYIYEKPSFLSASQLLKLPIKNAIQSANNPFVPIHTIPAPNLGTSDNHIHHHEEAVYTPPSFGNANFNSHQYQVTEEHTNDHTIIDFVSGQQKYFAPDPDPSLPTAKIRPATESFNVPSNGKPFPDDIQNNYLPPSPQNQALIQQFNSDNDTFGHHFPAEVYGLTVANQPQLQHYLLNQASTGQSAPISFYNPTYLVTQSKNLYNQHQQQKQLFKPNSITTYGTADLTQEVASDGQILQSAKDHTNQIHPEFRGPTIGTTAISPDLPSFAALIGGPPQIRFKQIPNDITTDSGFIVSNYFGNAQQNAQSYQQYLDLSQRQRENDRTLDQANLELQKQLLEQDAPNPEKSEPSAISAYEEHQRLLQQHLGEAPLRIFVPDEDYQSDLRPNLQKRSDNKSIEKDNEHDGEINEEYSDEEYVMEDNKKYDLVDNTTDNNQKDNKTN